MLEIMDVSLLTSQFAYNFCAVELPRMAQVLSVGLHE